MVRKESNLWASLTRRLIGEVRPNSVNCDRNRLEMMNYSTHRVCHLKEGDFAVTGGRGAQPLMSCLAWPGLENMSVFAYA